MRGCSSAPASSAPTAWGELSRVVIDPVTRSVTHLVVEPHHQLALARLVPIDLALAADREVRLRCTIANWRALAFAQEVEVPPFGSGLMGYPTAGLGWPLYAVAAPPMVVHECVPEGEIEIRRGEHIHAINGPIGHIEGLILASNDHHLKCVRLRHGRPWNRRDIEIADADIDDIDNIGLHVEFAKHAIAALPPLPHEAPR